MFIQVFMESVYALHSLADLGSFSVADPQQQVVLFTAYMRQSVTCITVGFYRASVGLQSTGMLQ